MNGFFAGGQHNQRRGAQRQGNWVSSANGNQGMAPGAENVSQWANQFGQSNMNMLGNFFDAQRQQAEQGFRRGDLANLNRAFSNAGRLGGASHALATGQAWGDYQSNLDAAQANQLWRAADAESARNYQGFMGDRQRAWQTGERVGAQDFQRGERLGSQRWQTGERQGSQTWQSGERALDRNLEREGWDFQAGEADKQRGWQSGERALDRGLAREGWDFQRGEREASQTWQGNQRQQDRDWQSEERRANLRWQDRQNQQQRTWQGEQNDLNRQLNAAQLSLQEKAQMWRQSMDAWQMGRIDAQDLMNTEQGRQMREDMMAMDKQRWQSMNQEQQRQYSQMAAMMLSNPGLDNNTRTKLMDMLMNIGGAWATNTLTQPATPPVA